MVSVVFHALRVAKHVPRLRARRATPATDGGKRGKKKKTRRPSLGAFMGAYPPQRCLSHAAYAPLCPPPAAPPVVSGSIDGGEERGEERQRGGDVGALRR